MWGSVVPGVLEASNVDAPDVESIVVDKSTVVISTPTPVCIKAVDVPESSDPVNLTGSDVRFTDSEGLLFVRIDGGWWYPVDSSGSLVDAAELTWELIADIITNDDITPIGDPMPYPFEGNGLDS